LTSVYQKRLEQLQSGEALPCLAKMQRGIEREALRVNQDGSLSQLPHPKHLGSKLCHPSITTDFSEAQPELITPVSSDISATLEMLSDIHRYTHSELGDEILWSASMPCILAGEDSIPLAQYGASNLGRLKTTYRNGLGNRYGRLMQTICAVHYNFSVPDDFWQLHWSKDGKRQSLKDYQSSRYFDLMRNFRRLSWLPIYLFGASPVVCNSFLKGRNHTLVPFDKGSLYAPYATSLRNGNLGYQSDTQSNAMRVSYNCLDEYIETLATAITTQHSMYAQIGTRSGSEYLQVNDSVLQAEAEFYTTIRAKRVPPPGVNFLKVLQEEGVDYVEVRLLDVNPYVPLGIDADEIYFLDTFLLYCLLTESPLHDDSLCRSVDANVRKTVYSGRDPALLLDGPDQQLSIKQWGATVLKEMAPIAALLDSTSNTDAYTRNLQDQHSIIEDPDRTLSARMLADMKTEGIPYFRFAMNKALEHSSYFRSQSLPPDRQQPFEAAMHQSRDDQVKIEQSDSTDFDSYLAAIALEYRELLEYEGRPSTAAR
jgi:glutamate--cysteine ligase|tara:strand:+ start:2445 stop:4061 length:1617 start_codon:yes stop_codon:yes gene_type:complete